MCIRDRIEIGTATPLDKAGPERTLLELQQLMTSFRNAPFPTEAEMTAIRTRWRTALRNIEAAVVRFDNGLLTWQDMHETLMAAASAATGTFPIRLPAGDTAQVRFVTRSGTNTATYSDAELIDALKAAATMSPDSARADALLSLAQRYAFTPDMVALYVAAANGIVSDSERARVFA